MDRGLVTPADRSTTAPGKLAGRLAVLATAVLWSSSGLFAKAPIFDDWPRDVRGLMLAFWRASFAALVLLPAVRRPRWRGYLLPLVLCFAGMSCTYLTAMIGTTAGNAIWLQNTAPCWVLVFTVLLFRQPLVPRDLIPLAFGVLGVGTILGFELGTAAQLNAGVLYGLISGVFYAGVLVLMWQLRDEDAVWLVVLNQGATALLLLPWIIWRQCWPSWQQLAVLVGFGAFQMALPYLLLVRGLRAISSQEAVAIALVEPVLIPLWVFLVWGERPAWWTIFGGALILSGLLCRYVFLEVWQNGPSGNAEKLPKH
jgi:drug/metabolite transporter, DME family